MLGFSSLWRRKDDSPAVSAKERGLRVDKARIGRPVLRTMPHRFEIYAGASTRDPLTRSSSHRSGKNSLVSGAVPRPRRPPLATRHPPPDSEGEKASYPLTRSYSLPNPVYPPFLATNGTANENSFTYPPGVTGRANSCSPLHLDLRRPLSPIREQSCTSPVSLKSTSPVTENEISALELSPRPPPFVQRTLSKSPTSAIHTAVAVSDGPPSIPELKLGPYFPGPHPSQDGDGPPRRPPKALIVPARSSAYSSGPGSSTGSLHAESFVTASNSLHLPVDTPDTPPLDYIPFVDGPVATDSATSSTLPVSQFETSQRLERHGTLTSGGSLRVKRQRFAFATPAFCAFWLGFLFPPIWWVGGWYFTFFAETPAQRTLWEHYVADTRWWAVLTCGCGRRCAHRKGAGAPLKPLLLPRWVGANNTAPSLKGISYYYPFVSRPAPGEPGHVTTGPPPPGFRRLHRLFDELTRSRLARVKLEQESPRRIIDPWIQRCRRALCYWCLAFLLFILAMMGWSFAVGTGKTHF
ncbi:hypothetical protein DFH07DRAFT_962355 [Mycena maculata]|uniref:Uncharacterized protein n=1 Tax=Mycena maculata TaxID=230809 RepID=A0AAD7N6H3_9AGAR|nr:hypothetical protein DFH07DRAFT_962355 [Mycena maculata]